MAEAVVLGRYTIHTVETRRDGDTPNEQGSWTSVAFIHRDGEAYPFSVVRTAPGGGDAFEARRHAIVVARRRIRRLENELRGRASLVRDSDSEE